VARIAAPTDTSVAPAPVAESREVAFVQ